ncbi:hypothetical protein A3G67_00295 [Candidatus Roizmanbacteria bacterium RIFCSPLOWO2_12_FULL_40_12]|uniref:Dockerin domain-containing protein n=1 Tax=Candidatus Roizmanbacteria bacterium RIFCSPLOWO2_01_FULL_40_42 TaxID=1802066 RepID=A0A1F7J6H5_9BACT|nr:MAG: hypothetical protein A2779_02515 [Candidatus Roizmanbacteria bacterium RIFCSPHIGHO2_01_FULL_40_98]OGK29094.1 MAG: hypothetical protein A3C31_03300 [Candidatus Roizmanbacteria bacterium RIFCSPHIGHO2_02_FULL_40_53]OGK29318.1 MAG: hypothetical protein A2W49_05080 [Candidatus Roizmanbacteria bacterium RIFCSPHIGHO2_12_41_18]OGK36017.1 MAG: hypothetical protein A3E69_03170 [Candidatus Roizmanbacteria bacterium RIFCSPHIGHO2_12_FULL_40_130]OGK51214.1 MAG: hypothetical protein A3B50_03280 [Candi
MANNDPSQSLFKRHKIFTIIFSFLFLALLLSSVAVVQQQQVYKTHAASIKDLCKQVRGGVTIFQESCGAKYNCNVVRDVYILGKKVGTNHYCGCPAGTTYNSSFTSCIVPKNTEGSGCSAGGLSGVCLSKTKKCSGQSIGNGNCASGLICCQPEGKEGTDKSGNQRDPVPAPKTSDACKNLGESACYSGRCPDGKESAGNQNCGGGSTCCKLVQSSACKNAGGTCLNDCAPTGKVKTGGGLCWGGKSCCVKPAGSTGGTTGGGGTGGGGGTTGGGAPAAPAPTAKAPTAAPATGGQTGSVTLNLKLKFQGVVKQPSSQFNNLKVKVSLSESVSGTGDFTSDAEGAWTGKVTLAKAPIGTPVSVFVKGPKHIQKKICVASPTETQGGIFSCQNAAITLKAGENTLDFSKILLLVGDLPEQDGVVDSNDVSFIRQNLTSTDADDLKIGDVNLNGIIDSQDFSLVIAALSIKTDDPLK